MVVQVLKNSVQAGIGDDGVAFASGDVRVAAQSRAQVALAGLAFGIAGTAAVSPGANALVFEDTVSAAAGGRITAGGRIEVTALGDTELYNIGAALAGAGNAAVSPIAIVTYFNGASEATVGRKRRPRSRGRDQGRGGFQTERRHRRQRRQRRGGRRRERHGVRHRLQAADARQRPRRRDAARRERGRDRYRPLRLLRRGGHHRRFGHGGGGRHRHGQRAENSVEASLGRDSIVYALTGDANIAAKAERDVASYAGSVSGSGTAAVARL